jgi:tetratricopeptide (TPR) repeat protein
MWVSSSNRFFRAGSGVPPASRLEASHMPATLRFAAKDKFDVQSKSVPSPKNSKDCTTQLEGLDNEMRQDKKDFLQKLEAYLLRRLEIQKTHLGDGSLEVALTLNQLGNFYQDKGEEEVDFELLAVDAEDEEGAQEHSEAAELHYGKALEYYNAALHTSRKNADPLANSLSIEILQSRANIYTDMGELTRSETDLAKALAMALDETVEKADQSPTDSIVLSLVNLLMADEENPRTEEVTLLKTKPKDWLNSRTPHRTLH